MLTQEQIDELRKVALATSEDPDDFLAMIVGRAEGWTKKLEAAGVGYKSKKLEEGRKVAPEESFVEQFLRSAVGPLDEEKSQAAPPLPGILDRAYSAVRRRDSTQAAVKSLADGTKASRAKLPNADDEALAQAVAKKLQPFMDTVKGVLAEQGKRLAAVKERRRDLKAMEAQRKSKADGHKGLGIAAFYPSFSANRPVLLESALDVWDRRFKSVDGGKQKPADFGFLWGYGRGPAQ